MYQDVVLYDTILVNRSKCVQNWIPRSKFVFLCPNFGFMVKMCQKFGYFMTKFVLLGQRFVF